MIVQLGNVAPHERTGETKTGKAQFSRVKIPSKMDGAVTTVVLPADIPLLEALTTIAAAETGVWANHSSEPPAWVRSDDEVFEMMLRRQFKCEAYDEDKHAAKFVFEEGSQA